jgi:hypothetical protein
VGSERGEGWGWFGRDRELREGSKQDRVGVSREAHQAQHCLSRLWSDEWLIKIDGSAYPVLSLVAKSCSATGRLESSAPSQPVSTNRVYC